LFTVAHNAFELTATNPFVPFGTWADEVPSGLVPALEVAPDFRLSTAAVLSARFPILTPAGLLRFRDQSHDLPTGDVVDGGYFDNSGLETLNEIIPEIAKIHLKIVVLYITNEPFVDQYVDLLAGHSIAPDRRPLRTLLTEPVASWWSRAFSQLREPLSTLNAVRTGHTEAAMERMLDAHTEDLHVVSIRARRSIKVSTMRGDAESVCYDRPAGGNDAQDITLYQPSMSWWLSPFAQAALDFQLCDYHNQLALGSLLRESATSPGDTTR